MKNSSKNWRNLLGRWISGEADHHDERSLEALANDDPFLSDALEGYRSVPEADHARSVTKLKAKLRSKYKKEQRGFVFYLSRIAAVGILLLASWFVFRGFEQNADGMQKKTAQETAIPESTLSTDTTAPDTTANLYSTLSKNDQATPPTEKESPIPKPYHNQIAEKKAAPPPPATSPPPPVQDEEMAVADEKPAENEPAAELTINSEAAKPEAPLLLDGIAIQELEKKDKAAELATAKRNEPPQMEADESIADSPADFNQTIKGNITDLDGLPLIGASVLIAKTDKGAVTDFEGNFTLQSPIQNPELLVSYTGYQTKSILANEGQFLNIQLGENAEALSEVVVTGLGKNLRSRKKSAVDIEPKGGFKKFKKYVKKNLNKPQAAIDAGIHGQVIVDFNITPDGRPVDFIIRQSLGYGCDEEAIRLLKNGPDWSGPPGSSSSFSFDF